MPIGTVVRFDRRRGYGFVQPDDGGEDVFVHQNNISMEGFRFLMVGEKVNYDLEVGEKGMKAVSVTLTEPRQERADQPPYEQENDRDGGDLRARPSAPRTFTPRAAPVGSPAAAPRPNGDLGTSLDRLRRKQERLISLLVEKGILTPGEVDGLDGAPVAAAPVVAAPVVAAAAPAQV